MPITMKRFHIRPWGWLNLLNQSPTTVCKTEGPGRIGQGERGHIKIQIRVKRIINNDNFSTL